MSKSIVNETYNFINQPIKCISVKNTFQKNILAKFIDINTTAYKIIMTAIDSDTFYREVISSRNDTIAFEKLKNLLISELRDIDIEEYKIDICIDNLKDIVSSIFKTIKTNSPKSSSPESSPKLSPESSPEKSDKSSQESYKPLTPDYPLPKQNLIVYIHPRIYSSFTIDITDKSINTLQKLYDTIKDQTGLLIQPVNLYILIYVVRTNILWDIVIILFLLIIK